MRTYLITFLIAATALSAISCNKETPQEEHDRLSLSIEGDMEQVGVYAAESNSSFSSERLIDNVLFTKDGNIYTSSDISAAHSVPDMHITAYYPYSQGILPAGSNVASVKVATDQSNIGAWLESDLMAGCTDIGADSQSPVKIEMKRIFARVNVTLKAMSADINLSDALARFTLNSTAEVDFWNCETVNTSGPAEITPRGSFKTSDNTLWSGVSFITVPQDIDADQQFISLTIGGESALYALGYDLHIESGMEYDMEIIANKSGDRYAIVIEVDESPWTAGTDISMEVDEEIEEIDSISDIDGNVYEVIKAGPQLWMASNLRTTRYNDGTPITYLEGKEEWAAVADTKEGAWCYYNNDESMGELYGYIYNWHAVETGKLCPEGWHVPSMAEYEMLFDFAGGMDFAGEEMKSTYGYRDYRNEEKPEYQGSNKSGFNGLPGGYRVDNGDFANEGRYGYWWSSTTQDGFNGDAFYLYYNSPAAALISPYFRTGYYVRCIKYQE